MPLYEYQCDSCAHRFERIKKFSDPPVETCPLCNGPVTKLVSSPAIQFKGSGWYITDYAKKSSSGGETKSGSAPDTAASGSTSTESSTSKGSGESGGSDSAGKDSSASATSKKT